jgi:hypothetical protein
VYVEYGRDVYAVSTNGGRAWERVEALPGAVRSQLDDPAPGSGLVCHPDDAQVCYRLAPERVEETSNGGQTWRTAWEIPAGRRTYMERYLNLPLSCRAEYGMDIGPYDLAFVDQAGQSTLVVAMGAQGVLVRGADGVWERHGVMQASPVPFSGLEWGMILTELALSLGAAVCVLFGLTALGWARLPRGWTKAAGGMWLIGAGVFVVVITLGATAGLLSNMGPVNFPLGLASIGLGLLLVTVGLLVGWARAARAAEHPGRVWRTARVSMLAGAAVVVAPVGLLSMWMEGMIATYEVALIAALVLVIGAVVWGVAAVLRLTRP